MGFRFLAAVAARRSSSSSRRKRTRGSHAITVRIGFGALPFTKVVDLLATSPDMLGVVHFGVPGAFRREGVVVRFVPAL